MCRSATVVDALQTFVKSFFLLRKCKLFSDVICDGALKTVFVMLYVSLPRRQQLSPLDLKGRPVGWPADTLFKRCADCSHSALLNFSNDVDPLCCFLPDAVVEIFQLVFV